MEIGEVFAMHQSEPRRVSMGFGKGSPRPTAMKVSKATNGRCGFLPHNVRLTGIVR